MSMDLIPRNRNIESFRISGIWWPIMLEKTSMGYVIGFGKSIEPVSFSYTPQGNNGTPCSNDGYRVSKIEAQAMALVAYGWIKEQRFLKKEWDAIPEREREIKKNVKSLDFSKPLYPQPNKNEKFIEVIEQFAEFAEKSSGFRIT